MLWRHDCTRLQQNGTPGRKSAWPALIALVGGCSLAQGGGTQTRASTFECPNPATQIELSTTLVLKSIIYMLQEILNTSVASGGVLEAGGWLEPDAVMLTRNYDLLGLSATLTAQQISDGLDDCDEGIDLIDCSSYELEISGDTLVSLRQTMVDMRSELIDAQ